MSCFIKITANTNRGDIFTSMNEISEKELALIAPVIEAIKGVNQSQTKNLPTNIWDMNDGEKTAHEMYVESGLVTEEAFETFVEYLPSNESGIRRISCIELLEGVVKKSLI